MREEKFKIIQFIRELLYKIESELDNFPKKDIEIKNRIKTATYDLLEQAYLANTTLDIELKKRLIEQIIAKIKVIDFLLNLSLDRELINGKRYIKLGEKLDNITKYANGWLNSIISSKTNKTENPI